MRKWNISNKRSLLSKIGLIIILLVLPLTLILVKQNQDTRIKAAAINVFLESGGTVTIETEGAQGYADNGSPHRWQGISEGTYPSSGWPIVFMQALPDNGVTYYAGEGWSPELIYNIYLLFDFSSCIYCQLPFSDFFK